MKLISAVTLLVPPERVGQLLIEIALAGGVLELRVPRGALCAQEFGGVSRRCGRRPAGSRICSCDQNGAHQDRRGRSIALRRGCIRGSS